MINTGEVAGLIKAIGCKCEGGGVVDPTGIIDDTACSGDTNKVWSADKSSALLNEKVNEPSSEGTDGQVLTTDGNGGRSWTDKPTVPAIATSAQVKAGTDSTHPLAPSIQHESVFYGLAKLAGADMASSSNPVGTFTADALVKIQKMLGVYDAPFRTIVDFTATQDMDYLEITTDTNGDQINLREIMVLMEFKTSNGTSNGAIRINNETNSYLTVANAFSSSSATSRNAHIQVIGGRLFGDATAQNQDNDWQQVALYANKPMRGILECDGITYIKVFSLNGYKIATDSKIKIIGR